MFKLSGIAVLLATCSAFLSPAHAGEMNKNVAGMTLKPGQWLFRQQVVMNGQQLRDFSYTKNYCLDEAYPVGMAFQKGLTADQECTSRILSSTNKGIEMEVICPGSKTIGKAEAVNENKYVYKGTTTQSEGGSGTVEVSMTFKKPASCAGMNMK